MPSPNASPPPTAAPNPLTRLHDLARRHLGRLTEAEEHLLSKAVAGKYCNCSSTIKKENDLSRAVPCGSQRTIKAELINWLCMDPYASNLVSCQGIRILGATIKGQINLSYAIVPFPLALKNCAIPDGLYLYNAKIPELNLIGSHTGPITAYQIRVAGSIVLHQGSTVIGGLRLSNSLIGGNLDCQGARLLRRPSNTTESRTNITMQQTSKQNNNESFKVLEADGITINGNLFLSDKFYADGEINLICATIGINLDCSDGRINNKNATAIAAEGIKVNGSVFLSAGFNSKGEIRFLGAYIGGVFVCDNGHFVNYGGTSIWADGITVKGGVFFRDRFLAIGGIRLLDAEIGKDLICKDGIILSNYKYKCFLSTKDDVLSAHRATINGSVIFINTIITGNVCFENAIIGRQFRFLHRLIPKNGTVLLDKAVINLASTKIGTLQDDVESWPAPGNVILHGLTFDNIYDDSMQIEDRIEWLNKMPYFSPQPYEHLASVYRKSGHENEARQILIEKNEALAKWRREARKNKTPSNHQSRHIANKIGAYLLDYCNDTFHRIIGSTVRYGYNPWRAVFISSIIIIIGAIIFTISYENNLMVANQQTIIDQYTNTEHKVYIAFNPLMYSIEAFLPIIDFGIEKYWSPYASGGTLCNICGSYRLTWGGLVRLYLWIQIALGWILTALFAGAISGLIRR